MQSHYKLLIEMGDRGIDALLSLNNQDMNPKSRSYGGMIEENKGFAEPAHVVNMLNTLTCLYYNSLSSHHNNAVLLERANLLAGYLLRSQHKDGTLDLLETNFHDASTLSFAIQVAAYTYRVIKKYSKCSDIENNLENTLYSFLKASAEGILNGGFHTPNHRWVITSALGLLYNILHDERLKNESMLYLQEGIDCDNEGEYTERSTGVYNVINNNSLIIIAEEFKMPKLYEYVNRNLNMMLSYIEPDYTMCTLNSRRQDYGLDVYPNIYYENYLQMAYKTQNPIFAWMADFTFNIIYNNSKTALMPYDTAGKGGTSHIIAKYMLDYGLEKYTPQKKEKPDFNCRKFYETSGIVRLRHDNISLTLVKGRSPFLKFQHGAANIHMRFAAAFFGTLGRFEPQEIKKLDNQAYRLSYHKQWGYIRPFNSPPATSIWDEMEHSKRENTKMQNYIVNIDIFPEEDGVSMNVNTSGVENVPYKIELLLQPNGYLETENLALPTISNGHAFLKGNEALYSYKGFGIKIKGGLYEYRASLPFKKA